MEILPILLLAAFGIARYYSNGVWLNLIDSLRVDEELTGIEKEIRSDSNADGIRSIYYVIRIVFRDIRISDFSDKHILSVKRVQFMFILETLLIILFFLI